jgi:arsenate reductase (thioredoxin)
MKILFVCVKNASRSPMAEALLKMAAKRDVKVCSAGIKPGREVNEQAVKAMREIGCDLSGHEPRHLSDFSNVKFDYVAKMDVPDLGDMVTAKWIVDWDIPDPAQGGIAEYRKIRQMIANKIRTELPRFLAQQPKRKRG